MAKLTDKQAQCREHGHTLGEVASGAIWCAICGEYFEVVEANELTRLRADAQLLADLQDEYPEGTKQDCDDCANCGPTVMCAEHSFISALHRRVATTGTIERDALRQRAETAREDRDTMTRLYKAERERDEAVAANLSAAVCSQHTDEFTRDGCLVCDLEAERTRQAQVEALAQQVAGRFDAVPCGSHDHTDAEHGVIYYCPWCEADAFEPTDVKHRPDCALFLLRAALTPEPKGD